MDRVEKVRSYVDHVLLDKSDATGKRCEYSHLYGVAQLCAMIALKRKENVELTMIAGMLHDIYAYTMMDSKEHAQKGAVMAREILLSLECFSNDEIDCICRAIAHHSDKGATHCAFDEVLIDADVLQHYLYNPLLDTAQHEILRLERLKKEFGLL